MHRPLCFITVALVALLGLACTTPASREARDTAPENYLDQCAFKIEPGNDWKLLRWRERQMPLRVFLPPPPEGLFDDAAAALAAVRAGVLAWTDVAKPGVPRFEFVDAGGQADIPFQWNASSQGHWFIAQAILMPRNERLTVSNVLITGRWKDGRVAALEAIQTMVTHEIGHALGINGHSPSPIDLMYPRYQPDVHELSDRDKATLRMLYAAPVGKRMSGARKRR